MTELSVASAGAHKNPTIGFKQLDEALVIGLKSDLPGRRWPERKTRDAPRPSLAGLRLEGY